MAKVYSHYSRLSPHELQTSAPFVVCVGLVAGGGADGVLPFFIGSQRRKGTKERTSFEVGSDGSLVAVGGIGPDLSQLLVSPLSYSNHHTHHIITICIARAAHAFPLSGRAQRDLCM